MYREKFCDMLEELEFDDNDLAAYFEKVVTEAMGEGTVNALVDIIEDFPLAVGPGGAKLVVKYELYGGDDADLLCSGETAYSVDEDVFDDLDDEFFDEDFEDDDDDNLCDDCGMCELEFIGEINGDDVGEMTEEEFIDFIRDVFLSKHKNNEELN